MLYVCLVKQKKHAGKGEKRSEMIQPYSKADYRLDTLQNPCISTCCIFGSFDREMQVE